MKYYIYILALCLLVSMELASPPAHASGTSVDMPLSAPFQLSSVAKATDNVSGEFSPGPGKIEITRSDNRLYIRAPGPAGNGTRLVSLDDGEGGITFRNNTLLLPLFAAGVETGTLVVATDNLTADSYGYAGMVTGLELDGGEIAAARDGHNFTAAAILSLADLPAGAAYRVAFGDSASMSADVAADLDASGLAMAAASPPLAVTASSQAADNAVSFVIVTVATEENWAGTHDDDNVTFYRLAGGQLSRLQFSRIKSDDGSFVYQAMAPGTGEFVLVAGTPRSAAAGTVTASDDGLFILGGLLAALVIALAVMVGRVSKR